MNSQNYLRLFTNVRINYRLMIIHTWEKINTNVVVHKTSGIPSSLALYTQLTHNAATSREITIAMLKILAIPSFVQAGRQVGRSITLLASGLRVK